MDFSLAKFNKSFIVGFYAAEWDMSWLDMESIKEFDFTLDSRTISHFYFDLIQGDITWFFYGCMS